MKITEVQLINWGVSSDVYTWFRCRYADGEAEYQDVLNAMAKDDRPLDADWLMNHAGPDDQSVIEIDSIADCDHFFAAGHLVIKNSVTVAGMLRAGGGIKAGEGIEAGWGIEAGLGIEAGGGIEAGWGIKAGEGIEAGRGFGIFAGLCIQIANWTIYAKVIAKFKPNNLISGSWEPTSEDKKVSA